jgi:hypothetical protein
MSYINRAAPKRRGLAESDKKQRRERIKKPETQRHRLHF